MDEKIIKVEFTLEDGSTKYIDGLELERWKGFLTQVIVMATAKNMNPDWSKVKWIKNI